MNNINLPNHDSYAYIKSRYYKKPKSKTITKVNGNRLDEIEKEMEYNKSKYEKRIKQLKVITEDVRYIPKDSTDSYHEFIFNMHSALVGGRKITSKMESAINKIVSGYTKWLKKENSPGYQKEKIEFIENSLSKIKLLKDKLNEAEYSRSYTSDKEYFLDSIKTQIKNRASLTEKQRAALNTMYNKFNKRIEKNKKGK
jgi:hypothetical protein|tara:strand:+ start:766 stop:1359 length:594 start_codon:yes stop_codon:yes gene_type:complete